MKAEQAREEQELEKQIEEEKKRIMDELDRSDIEYVKNYVEVEEQRY